MAARFRRAGSHSKEVYFAAMAIDSMTGLDHDTNLTRTHSPPGNIAFIAHDAYELAKNPSKDNAIALGSMLQVPRYSGTPRFPAFVILHELDHTTGALPPDFTRRVQDENNDAIARNCHRTIASFPNR